MSRKPTFTPEQQDELYSAIRRVRASFQADGKAQTHLAEALGVTQQLVSSWLAGRATMGEKTAAAIARLDGKSLRDIVGDYGVPAEAPRLSPDDLAAIRLIVREEIAALLKHNTP